MDTTEVLRYIFSERADFFLVYLPGDILGSVCLNLNEKFDLTE